MRRREAGNVWKQRARLALLRGHCFTKRHSWWPSQRPPLDCVQHQKTRGATGPPAPAHLLSHWSKSGPGGPDSSVPAGVPAAFQTFQVKPHGTLGPQHCIRAQNQEESASGTPSWGWRLLNFCVSTSGDMGSFQMPALTPGGRRRARAPALVR